MINPNITKDEIQELPLLKFKGKIIVADDEESIGKVMEELSHHERVGFDTESKPNFKKGKSNPLALMQFAVDKRCYLVRVHRTGVIRPITDFMANADVVKIGLALDDDFHQLKKQTKFTPQSFIDLNKLAPKIGIEKIGVKNLSAIFLNGRVSKNQQTSNWENPILTDAQLSYAATDAWVCLKIYEKMLELKMVG